MNLKALWQNKSSRIAIIAGAGVLAAVAAFVIVGAVDSTPGWAPAPFAGLFGTSESGSETVDGTAAEMAQAPKGATPVSSGSTGGQSSGTPSAPGTSAPDDSAADTTTPTTPGDSGDTPADEPAAVKTMTLRIMYWNDTESKAATGLRVSVDDASWSPADAAAESAVGKLVGLPFDTKLTLVVTPDGANGKRIEVPILLTPDMIPDSEGDAVHVEVKDGTVRVLGTPVDNFDVTQDRF